MRVGIKQVWRSAIKTTAVALLTVAMSSHLLWTTMYNSVKSLTRKVRRRNALAVFLSLRPNALSVKPHMMIKNRVIGINWLLRAAQLIVTI